MRKRFKIPIALLVVFLLAIAVTLVIVTKTNFLERRVNEFLSIAIEQKYGLEINIGDIGGSIFSGVMVSDVVVRYGNDDHRIASIKYLAVDYDLSDLLHKRWLLHSLFIDSLVVNLRERADGTLEVPSFGGNGDDDEESGGFDFSVDSMILTNSSVTVQRGPEKHAVDSLSLFCSVSKSAGLFQADIRACVFAVPGYGFHGNRLSGTVTMRDSLVIAENLKLTTDSSAIDVEAEILIQDPLEFSAELRPSLVNFQELKRVSGLGLNGAVDVSGTVEAIGGQISADIELDGTLIGWKVRNLDGELTFDDNRLVLRSLSGSVFGGTIDGAGFVDLNTSPKSFGFTGAVKGFDLRTIAKNSFDTDLSGNIELDGEELSGSKFQIDVVADLDWGRFDDYTFDSLSGRFHINKDSIVFAYPFNLFYRSTSVDAGGLIEYKGNMYIDGEAGLPVIDEFRNQIFLEDIGGRGTGKFTLSGPTNDPDVTGSFNSDSAVIYDLTSSDFLALIDIKHFFTEPVGGVEVFSGEFDYSGLDGDLLQARLHVDPERTWIDDATVSMPPFLMNLAGMLDTEEDSMLLTLTEFTAEIDSEVIGIDESALISFSDSGINVLSADLTRDSDRVSSTGFYRYDGKIGFDVAYDSLNVRSWLPYFLDKYRLEGRLSGSGQISGDLVNPVFDFDFEADSTLFEGEPLGNLVGRLSYRDTRLNLENAVLTGARNTSTAEGFIPVDLAFESRDSRLLEDDSLGLNLSVSGTSFDLLEVLFDDIEWCTGAFSVDVSASGTPRDMLLAGDILVDGGICKIYDIENPVEEIAFSGEFDGRQLTIREMGGTLKRNREEGRFTVVGSIDLSDLTMPDYDLTVSGFDLPVKYDLGDIEARIEEADLTITGSDPPVVTGDLDLARFLYQESFFDEIEPDALEAADTTQTFDYNVRISIPQNMWIKNEDADVELRGDLIILKEGRLENFLGTLEIIRGKLYLTNFNRTFTFEPGGEIVFDNIEEFNPRFQDVRMTTLVRDSSGTRDICMQISETLENPNIDVCPESEYAIDEVWVLMNPIGTGFGESEPADTLANGEKTSIADRLTVGATGIALSQASRYISRRLGVETFEVNTSPSGNRFNPLEAELTIGFYTTPRLYIYGTSQLSFGSAEELGFDYSLSRHVFISGQRDRDNLFHLNISLNWEFE